MAALLLYGSALLPAEAAAAAAPGASGSLTLFSERFYHGRSVTLRQDDADARADFAPRSFRVEGRWQVCSEPGYRGRCVDLERDYPLDAELGLNFAIRSLRSTALGNTAAAAAQDDGYPSANVLPGGASLTGLASRYFPAPTYGRDRALACPAGKLRKNTAGKNCARHSAEDLCRRIGYRHAASYLLQTERGRIYLADVLCTRTRGGFAR